jgi:hypothetical protein
LEFFFSSSLSLLHILLLPFCLLHFVYPTFFYLLFIVFRLLSLLPWVLVSFHQLRILTLPGIIWKMGLIKSWTVSMKVLPVCATLSFTGTVVCPKGSPHIAVGINLFFVWVSAVHNYCARSHNAMTPAASFASSNPHRG